MSTVLRVGVIVLPLLIFLIIFANNILISFIENENDLIEAENEIKRGLVEGEGWTDPGDWTVSE